MTGPFHEECDTVAQASGNYPDLFRVRPRRLNFRFRVVETCRSNCPVPILQREERRPTTVGDGGDNTCHLQGGTLYIT